RPERSTFRLGGFMVRPRRGGHFNRSAPHSQANPCRYDLVLEGRKNAVRRCRSDTSSNGSRFLMSQSQTSSSAALPAPVSAKLETDAAWRSVRLRGRPDLRNAVGNNGVPCLSPTP